LKEKTLDEKLAKETAEFERQKDSIEMEKKDLESQRLAVRAKEEKFVKIKQEHKAEIAKLES
jgi:septal ring factor EnvC (AmiA/AmiB activator)